MNNNFVAVKTISLVRIERVKGWVLQRGEQEKDRLLRTA